VLLFVCIQRKVSRAQQRQQWYHEGEEAAGEEEEEEEEEKEEREEKEKGIENRTSSLPSQKRVHLLRQPWVDSGILRLFPRARPVWRWHEQGSIVRLLAAVPRRFVDALGPARVARYATTAVIVVGVVAVVEYGWVDVVRSVTNAAHGFLVADAAFVAVIVAVIVAGAWGGCRD